jgi:hypothetical protein
LDIDDIRRYLDAGRYQVSGHAAREAANDQILPWDIASIARSGEIIAVDDVDARGTEYLVEGRTSDGRTARMKVAVGNDGALRIITVYSRRRKRR